MIINLVACSSGKSIDNMVQSTKMHYADDKASTEDLTNNSQKKDYEFETLAVSVITLLFAFVGGCFALHQWNKNSACKRAEVVKSLIESVRGNPDISTIMDIIDWNEDFTYNGKFSIQKDTKRKALMELSDDELFKKIDRTLAMFSYICYLKSIRTITKKDMCFFEYELRRLVDNPHISNYLYSLYHWSNSLGVKMSFSYLIDYGIKNRYLDKSFKKFDANHEIYECFLFVDKPPIS